MEIEPPHKSYRIIKCNCQRLSLFGHPIQLHMNPSFKPLANSAIIQSLLVCRVFW